jgi:hypothetical protein
MNQRADDDLQGKLMDLAHELWQKAVVPHGKLGVSCVCVEGGGTMIVSWRNCYSDEITHYQKNGKKYTIEVVRRNIWLPQVNGVVLPYQKDVRTALIVALEEFYA